MARVRVPTPLRPLTRDQEEVSAAGRTVGEVLRSLGARYPGLGARLFDEEGRVRRYVSVFHNDEDIRLLGGLATPVEEGDCITLVPAIAGG